jgi:hypothetical protein
MCQRPFHRSCLRATPGQSAGDMVRDDENAASTKDPMDHMERVQRMQKKKTNKHVFANRYYQNGTHIRGEVAAGYMV